jgi:hypothetical protein
MAPAHDSGQMCRFEGKNRQLFGSFTTYPTREYTRFSPDPKGLVVVEDRKRVVVKDEQGERYVLSITLIKGTPRFTRDGQPVDISVSDGKVTLIWQHIIDEDGKSGDK